MSPTRSLRPEKGRTMPNIGLLADYEERNDMEALNCIEIEGRHDIRD